MYLHVYDRHRQTRYIMFTTSRFVLIIRQPFILHRRQR